MKHLVEFRDLDRASEVGDEVTVAEFEEGQKVKVSATAIGKGFQGTVKRHNFGRGPVSHGSHNVRAPGSIGASADPARVFKGMKMPGRMGGKRATQRGLELVPDRRRAQPADGPRRGPRPQERHRGGAERWLRRPQGWPRRSASRPRATCPRPSSASRSTSRWSTRPRAPSSTRAARAPHSSLTRGEVAMTGAKAWKQKGTGRARVGALSVPHRRGGGAAFGPKPRHYISKVNRKARRKALRSALSVHAARDSLAVLPRRQLRRAEDQEGGRGARQVGRRDADPGRDPAPRTAAAKSFRNIARVDVAGAEGVGVAEIIGARSLVVSEAALEVARAPLRRGRARRRAGERRAPDGRPPGHHRAR